MIVSHNSQTPAPASGASSSDNRPSIVEVVKRKRGRPTLAEELARAKEKEMQQAAPITREVFKPDMVEGISNLPFSLAAIVTKNKEWNLSDEDKSFVAPSLADWLNELWPEITGKYPRLAVLCVMYGGLFVKKSGEVIVKKMDMPVSPVPEAARPPKPEPKKTVVVSDGMSQAERIMREREIEAANRV